MSDQCQSALKTQRRKRLHERAAEQVKQAESRPESPKRDTGPRVTRYEPEAPPWASPDWKPAATGASVSEALERHRAMQVWEALRARYATGGVDSMGNRIGVPPGFDPITGHKL